MSQECADSNPAGCIVKDYGTRGESGGGEGSGAAASGGDDSPCGEGGGDDGSVTN